MQLRVLSLGLFQDGDVGIGVFPEGEEVSRRQGSRPFQLRVESVRKTDLVQKNVKSRIGLQIVELGINASHRYIP